MANQTKIADLINPEVMADMISAKVEKKLIVAPFATIDTSLQGVPGDTITVPKYGYIGDAEDVAEGIACGTVKLTTSATEAKVKKAMKAVELTDEAILSGYGNPVGETNNQLALAIASKVDNDAMEALYDAKLIFDGSASAINYDGVVDAIDLFDEEVASEKVMFINPKQKTTLRKDKDFIDKNKYTGDVMFSGEIGSIAGARAVVTKKVKLNDEIPASYSKVESSESSAKEVVADTASPTSSQIKISDVTPCVKGYEPVVGDYVKKGSKINAGTFYINPIVKLNNDDETEEDTNAITVYLKRDTNVETERNSLSRSTDISADKFYTVALSNEAKVVLAQFKK